ncbi:helix-turn-helix transcriptional regulator [Tomitella cavernea]|nr:transcriptional regulator [Tomitella cavernea]
MESMHKRGGSGDGTADVAAVSALDEPTRGHLYDLICDAAVPIGRDEAANALGIPRKTAAFHLDKLAEVGLLEISFARRGGRRGPGAGRPSKFYHRAQRQIAVQIPARAYEMAGKLLADAVAESERTGDSALRCLSRGAAALGREIGAGSGATVADLMAVLRKHGYEPRLEDGTIVLANCPFHSLVRDHTAMVCGMNLDLIGGAIEGARCEGCHARLEPHDGYCCVRIDPAS